VLQAEAQGEDHEDPAAEIIGKQQAVRHDDFSEKT